MLIANRQLLPFSNHTTDYAHPNIPRAFLAHPVF
jgi:hypothetical protein